ncbi:MAG TPA: hypothetical protein VEL28_22855 [Candidatus Binatia bacterium]|nr:hypothetical protein [Candidatus Binatia bacterium]
MHETLRATAKWMVVFAALLLSAAWVFFTFRLTAVGVFGTLLIALLFIPLHRQWRIVASIWVLLLVCTLVPIDVRFDGAPGLRPRVLPILWGEPSARGHALFKEGKAWEGGCIVPFWNPRWALVL